MWLEAMSPKVDANDCKAFQMIYEKLLVMFGQLQAENKKLKEKVDKGFDEQQIHGKFLFCFSLLTVKTVWR